MRVLAAFLLFLALAVSLQWKNGVFWSEFTGHSDEPIHYLTGLMVKDYVAAGLPGSPREFAAEYYLHYPKVGLGHWPPVFYVVQAAWTLVFSHSRVSILILMAVLLAVLATVLYRSMSEDFGAWAGIGAGLLLVTLPTNQRYSGMVMAELLVSLTSVLAVLSFGRYLDSGSIRHSVWFGIWSSLAILTKGTGIALAGVPILSILLLGRFDLLRRISFWIPALIVLTLCGPWHLLAPGANHEAFIRYGGIRAPVGWAVPLTVYVTATLLGVAFLPVILVGFVERFVRRRSARGYWIAGIAYVASNYLCRFSITVWEARHLIALAPVLVLFLGAGASHLLAWAGSGIPLLRRSTVKASLCGLALAVAMILNVRLVWAKPSIGYTQLAKKILARDDFRDRVILISTDFRAEGVFLAELALHDQRRPGHVVLRAGKALAEMGWSGQGYKLVYRTPPEVMSFLEEIPVGVVIVDRTIGPVAPHDRMLIETLQAYPERWREVELFSDGERPPRELQVYQQLTANGQPVGKLTADLKPLIQRFLRRWPAPGAK